jgi:hypothetical protein
MQGQKPEGLLMHQPTHSILDMLLAAGSPGGGGAGSGVGAAPPLFGAGMPPLCGRSTFCGPMIMVSRN